MEKKYFAIILVAIVIGAIITVSLTEESIAGFIFDQIPYSYTSHILIPSKDPQGASLGGYCNINGKGRDFKFHLEISGAEKSESPLDYVQGGLRGQGRIDNIQITYNTISSLYQHDFKGAMFGTKFNGNMNMSCAAWTGTSQFQNNGTSFTGSFIINGAMTHWIGTYTVVREYNRIAINTDFIYYPNDKPSAAERVQNTFYF